MTYFIVFVIIILAFVLMQPKSGGNGSYTNIDVSKAKQLLIDEKLNILDVRTAAEINRGAIKGHKHINIMDSSFNNKIDFLDKDRPYLVYCRSGRRSARACQIMSKKGFTKLYNLSGGFNSWK